MQSGALSCLRLKCHDVMQALAGSLQRLHGEEGLCGCLDALLTTMLECESTQARFVQLQGVERVAPSPAAMSTPSCHAVHRFDTADTLKPSNRGSDLLTG